MSKQYPGGIISKTPVTPSGPYETSTASGIWTLDQQAYWAKQGQWPIAGNPPPDAQFNYVTMLLHGDGTNGAQNNTFLDSSTNNFTITRNGNTTQGSFSPYGSNWSNYFNGTSSVSFPSNSAFAFDTGAYTVEMWVFITGVGSGGYSHFFNAGNATGSFGFAIYSDYSLNVFGYGTGGVIAGSANDITPNQWQHIAVCRSSTSSNATKIYVNGVLKTTGTDSTNWTVTTTPSVGGLTSLSGYSTVGYISNCRVVKGTAVYTSAFTPSTTPLTAISGTSLLTCQSNRFIDNSTNAFTTTVNGTPSVQRFNPFGASTAYSTSVIGGSGYFDGSGDYLSAPSNSAFTLGTGDFTIECWYYPSVSYASGNGYLFDMGSNGTRIQLYLNTVYFLPVAGSSIQSATGVGMSIAWHHVAAVRSGSTMTLYVDGVSVGTATNSSNLTDTLCRIGSAGYTGDYFTGYISNFRVVKGTAIYSGSTYTIPTAPLTAVSGTSLLTNMTNGAIYDNAMMNDLETVGNAQISTSVVKYGTGSLYFDGTGDYLIGPSTPNMNFGSGDFTVEAWVYRQVTSGGNQTIYQKGRVADSDFEFTFVINASNQLEVYYSTSGTSSTLVATTTASVSQNTWTHVAVARSGSTWRIFIGGTLDVSATASVTLYTGTGRISIATNTNGDNPFTGYIDDLRITKGYARYTTTFTPPTTAFSNIGPT